jgi:hypothetical protein
MDRNGQKRHFKGPSFEAEEVFRKTADKVTTKSARAVLSWRWKVGT